MNRGDAAAGTLLFRGDGATARPRRGYSVETRRDGAAATWTFRRDRRAPRLRHGHPQVRLVRGRRALDRGARLRARAGQGRHRDAARVRVADVGRAAARDGPLGPARAPPEAAALRATRGTARGVAAWRRVEFAASARLTETASLKNGRRFAGSLGGGRGILRQRGPLTRFGRGVGTRRRDGFGEDAGARPRVDGVRRDRAGNLARVWSSRCYVIQEDAARSPTPQRPSKTVFGSLRETGPGGPNSAKISRNGASVKIGARRYDAFLEAAAALRAVDLDALANLAEPLKHVFWVNCHNLCVLHACVATGPPSTASAFAPVTSYYAWARRQRYAIGGIALSALQMEHAVLRRGDGAAGALAGALLLPRFGADDPRAALRPRATPPALALTLFAATRSSPPLRVVRAEDAATVWVELKAHAADVLRRGVAVAAASPRGPLGSRRTFLPWPRTLHSRRRGVVRAVPGRSGSSPRRRRDASLTLHSRGVAASRLRTLRVVAAASPRRVYGRSKSSPRRRRDPSADVPRRSRGVAATRLRTLQIVAAAAPRPVSAESPRRGPLPTRRRRRAARGRSCCCRRLYDSRRTTSARRPVRFYERSTRCSARTRRSAPALIIARRAASTWPTTGRRASRCTPRTIGRAGRGPATSSSSWRGRRNCVFVFLVPAPVGPSASAPSVRGSRLNYPPHQKPRHAEARAESF